jgi:hypothetical protein
MDDLNNITDEDGQTGFIYILRSLSTDPQITALPDLYKIGFSTVPVKERVKNAADDPTYLMAPLSVIEEAIELIISGKIVDYIYDEESRLIREK